MKLDAILELCVLTTERNTCHPTLKNISGRGEIKHETSVAHCPQQNGVAERMNRTVLNSARAVVYPAKLSKVFWAEAVNTAAYSRNRVVTAT